MPPESTPQVARSLSSECASTPVLLVPVGATEQHGPHLPLGTDTAIASVVTARAGRIGGHRVGPSLPFGASGEHETFPGTISIGVEALAAVVVELGRSACRWASRVVLVNGHGGNVPALQAGVALLRSEGRDVAWFACGVPGADAHAGRYETSVMMALDSSTVRLDRAEVGNTAPIASLLPVIRESSVRAVSENGVLGDPTEATAAEGAESLAVMAAALVEAVEHWSVSERSGRLR